MQIELMPDLSLLAVMVIFLLNYFVVSRYLIKPVNAVLEERATEARSAQQTYEQALARFTTATNEIEERLHHARREASQMRDTFRTEAASHRAAAIEKTSADAKRVVADAESRLDQDVAAAREKIVRDSDSLAKLAAERIVGRAL